MDSTTCNLLHMTLQCALCISKLKKKSREIKKKERKKERKIWQRKLRSNRL